MAANTSQAPGLSYKNPETSQLRSAHSGGHAAAATPPENAPVSTAHESRTSSNIYHHTAFMQCRFCCNCHAQCSYYGKGHFDVHGNYTGP